MDATKINTVKDILNLNQKDLDSFMRLSDIQLPVKNDFKSISIRDVINLTIVEENLSVDEFKSKYHYLMFVDRIQKGQFYVHVNFDEESYLKAIELYQKERGRREQIFEEMMQHKYLTIDVKGVHEEILKLALESGHANGYSEVEIHYEEYADLINKVGHLILSKNK